MNPVIVERYPGDSQGPDISDQLITTEPVAIARGTAEIDYSCSDRRRITATGPVRDFLAYGDIVEVVDMEEGQYRAMVTDFAVTIDRRKGSVTAQSSMIIEALAG